MNPNPNPDPNPGPNLDPNPNPNPNLDPMQNLILTRFNYLNDRKHTHVNPLVARILRNPAVPCAAQPLNSELPRATRTPYT